MKYVFYNILFFICLGLQAQKSMQQVLTSHNTRSVPYISATETRMLQLHKEALILDARKFEEFQVSKIPSAQFFGEQGLSEEALLDKKDKTQPIIVYCSIGIRSETIAAKLKKLGFTNVRNLYGGIFEWKNEGYPVLDSKGYQTEKVHTFSKAWAPYLKKGIKVN